VSHAFIAAEVPAERLYDHAQGTAIAALRTPQKG